MQAIDSAKSLDINLGFSEESITTVEEILKFVMLIKKRPY